MKLSVFVVSQDRRIRKVRKKTFVEWIYDEANQVGWFVLRRLFATNIYFDNKVGLILDSGYAIPLNPYNDYDADELIELTDLDKRSEQAMLIVEGQAEKENRQNTIARSVSLGISGLVFAVVILVILVAVKRI